jgi:aryl-alcohol dehydrogenase-like predicted oxidoreductase
MKEPLMRNLGPFRIPPVGLGCMPLSGFPPSKAWILSERDTALGVIHAALDAGVRLLDTSDIYAPTWNSIGHNEILVSEGLRTWSGSAQQKAEVVIATKGGITRAPEEGNWFGISGRDASEHYLYRAVEASAARMKLDTIQLWQHHRLNHFMPFEEQFENVMKLKAHGIVQNVGVSNYSPEQLRLAIKIGGTPEQGGLISVQNEWSPRSRAWPEVLEICEQYGIAFLPWSPLGGIDNAQNLENAHFDAFESVAKNHGVSKFAIAIAWHLANSPIAIPIPGATRKESIIDSFSGVKVVLSADELAQLNDSLPPNPPLHEELIEQPPFRS